MTTIQTKYLGSLRTESQHVASGNTLLTDAPKDNFGKGESFSPTDLLATSLATCMLTVMAIAATKEGIELGDVSITTVKIMAANPRRVSELQVVFTFPPALQLTSSQQQWLIDIGLSCPVAQSLHPDLHVDAKFHFAGTLEASH
jgi:uncharacterized OsmC-like protein